MPDVNGNEVATFSLDGADGFNLQEDAFYEVYFSGGIKANSGDTKLLLRFNGEQSNHKSFVILDGNVNASIGEWDSSGILLGRNGWGHDALCSGRVVFNNAGEGNYYTVTGGSTFAHDDQRLLGFTSSGFWIASNNAANSISLILVGPGEKLVDFALRVVPVN